MYKLFYVHLYHCINNRAVLLIKESCADAEGTSFTNAKERITYIPGLDIDLESEVIIDRDVSKKVQINRFASYMYHTDRTHV